MTLNIARFLDPNQYDVIFYIIGKDKGLIQDFIPEGSETRFIKVQSYKDALIFKIIKTLFKEKPDYAFCSLMPINWRLCVASIFFPRIKVIIRANDYLHTQSKVQKLRLFLAYKFATKFVVQTDEMRNEHIKLLSINPQRVVTLANPINTSSISKKTTGAESPFNDAEINYVFVGRIDPIKGIDVLIRSFASVQKVQHNAILYIIGQTGGIFQEYYHILKQLAYDLGMTEHIKFIGYTDNPYVYMKYASCFVLPSKNEGLPNVVLESLYLGTAVAVTASVPVIRRIVDNGSNGFVVEVDDVNALADAMINASGLGRVKSGYKSATKEDFQKLFY
jgi:glycosyltransferase involved in cell wall biosynthesis